MCGIFDSPSPPPVAPAPPPAAPAATPKLRDANKVAAVKLADGSLARKKMGLSSLTIDPTSGTGLTIPK